MESISDSWGSEETKCKCTEWEMCDYCKEKKEDEEICFCSHGIICHNCESSNSLTDNILKTEKCKYCEEDKSFCNCYSCFCCCRQNSRILFKILEDKSGLNKKTNFTYKDMIEKNSDFKEYIENIIL